MAKLTKLALKKESTTTKKTMKKVMKSKKKPLNKKSDEMVIKRVKEEPAVIGPRVEEKGGKLDDKTVKSGINALRQVIAKKLEEKKELFDGEQPILMQVNLVKIPKCPARVVHFQLPHSLATPGSEMCLFVPDIKGDENDFEKAVKHYENLLEKKRVAAKIHKIIPLKQLRKEHSEFESKRKLAQLYDYFLVDGRIQGYVCKMFGNALSKSNKGLITIKMQVTDLNNIIKKSLHKVDMTISSKGNTQVIKIGHTDMTDEQLSENVVSAFNALEEHLPGGTLNVRSVILKTATSLAIPIYDTLKKNSEVNVPIILAPKTKGHMVIKDELSTHINSNVVVYPSGDVKTVKIEGENEKPDQEMLQKPGKKVLRKPTNKVMFKSNKKLLRKPTKSKRKAAIKENIKGILKETGKAALNQNGKQKPQKKGVIKENIKEILKETIKTAMNQNGKQKPQKKAAIKEIFKETGKTILNQNGKQKPQRRGGIKENIKGILKETNKTVSNQIGKQKPQSKAAGKNVSPKKKNHEQKTTVKKTLGKKNIAQKVLGDKKKTRSKAGAK